VIRVAIYNIASDASLQLPATSLQPEAGMGYFQLGRTSAKLEAGSDLEIEWSFPI
jgi:hypothetical protein